MYSPTELPLLRLADIVKFDVLECSISGHAVDLRNCDGFYEEQREREMVEVGSGGGDTCGNGFIVLCYALYTKLLSGKLKISRDSRKALGF